MENTILKPGVKFKLANNDVEVHSIDEANDKIYLLVFDPSGMAQLHTDGFGLSWVMKGFEVGVNHFNKSWT